MINSRPDLGNINSIRDVAILVAQKLNIDPSSLITIIEKKELNISESIDETIKGEIIKLLNADDDINNFNKFIKSKKVQDNFNILKKNLAELQVRVILKKLEKVEKCDDVINVLLSALNNKLEITNNMIESNLQKGGSYNLQKSIDNDINYYNKYLKYKFKYYKLKYN